MQPGQLPPRETKDIYTGDDARRIVMAGARKMFEAVASVYGPAATNALLGLPYGDASLTRDGVTVAKRVILPNRAENDAAQVLRQASDKTNKTAGDGTTATVVLSWFLLDEANKRVAAGHNPMVVKRQLDSDARQVIKYLKGAAAPAEEYLTEVATVSAGDAAIGQLIADTMREVGTDGGISIREVAYPVTEVEKVNGYYFDRGFPYLNQMVTMDKPWVVVSQKRLTANTDILPILNVIYNSSTKKAVIIGDVSGDALNTLVTNSMQGKFEAVVIPPPVFGEEGTLQMEDIASYVGATLIREADNTNLILPAPQTVDQADELAEQFFGAADRVQAGSERAIVFGGHGDGEEIAGRAAALKQQIDTEPNAHRKAGLENRYQKLVGKIAIVNVGGSTPTEMEELRFRVEDAIEATKSAMQDGVLPGGASMLAKAATAFDTELVSPMFVNALENTFKQLFSNSGENAERRLGQVQDAKFGFGFNLRKMTEKPVDLAKDGIWDAARSVVQTIENATSAAGALLTVGTIIAIQETKDEGN